MMLGQNIGPQKIRMSSTSPRKGSSVARIDIGVHAGSIAGDGCWPVSADCWRHSPGRRELASPDPGAGALGLALGLQVVRRVLAVIQRPALADDTLVLILAADVADGQRPRRCVRNGLHIKHVARTSTRFEDLAQSC